MNTTTETGHSEACLTYDVLMHIFNFLDEKRDLAISSGVCRLWRKVALNPVFLWEVVRQWHTDSHHWELDCIPYAGKFTIEVLQLSDSDPLDFHLVAKDIKGNILGTVKETNGLNDKQYLKFVSLWPRSWRCTPYVMNAFNKKRYNPKDVVYRINVEFNPKKFEQELRKLTPGKESEIEAFDMIRQYASSQNMRFVAEYSKRPFVEARKPPHYEADPQPEGFKPNVKLYDYQLEAITWMKTVELEMPEVEYNELIPWRVPDSTLYFTLDGKVVWSDREDLNAYTVTANPKGGVLADETGLGKTVEMLGLILANPAESASDELSEPPPKKEIDDLFYTPATLVLCPSHVLHHWEREIKKFIEKPLKVIIISNWSDLVSITYRDICKADLVISTYQFLKNIDYFNIGQNKEHYSIKMDEEIHRLQWTQSHLENIRKLPHRGLDSATPIFEHFIWHRLVLDEGHEVMDVPFYVNTIMPYIADNKWYMTCVPFAKGSDLMRHIVQFLEFPESESFMSWSQFEPLLENRFWRNTRDSTKNELEEEVFSEEVVFLDFSPIERLFYDDLPNTEKDIEKLEQKRRDFCGTPLQKSNSLFALVKTKCESLHERIEVQSLLLTEKRDFLIFLHGLLDNNTSQDKGYGKFMQELQKHESHEAKEQIIESTISQINKEIKELESTIRPLKEYHHKVAITHLYNGPDLNAQAYVYREVPQDKKDKVLTVDGVYCMNKHKLRAELKKRGISSGRATKTSKLQKLLENCVIKEEKERQEKKMKEMRDEKEKSKKRNLDETSGGYVAMVKKPRGEREEQENAEDDMQMKDAPLGIHGFLGETQKILSEEAQRKETETKTESEEKVNEQAKEGEGEKEKEKAEEPGKEKEGDEQDKREKEEDETITFNESDEGESEEDMSDTELQGAIEKKILDFLIHQHGTKLAHLFLYLRNLWAKTLHTRVVIFSQNNELLDKVYKTFQEHNVRCAFIVGDVLQLKARFGFIEKSAYSLYKVVLLNLENVTAGTMFIECTHFFLMDPLTGTRDEVTSMESKVISRAYRPGQTKPIKVVRMLIKDTIEDELYKKNHSSVQEVSSLVRSASSLIQEDLNKN